MSCAVEQAKGWAIGMVAAAIALALIAVGVGGAIALSNVNQPKPTKSCAKGHDELDSNQFTTFVCDLWVPAPAPAASP